MQHKKKLLTTLTITILTLSIFLAAVPMASAITITSLDPSTGSVGTKVLVTGAADTYWGLVTIYWNTPAAENKLNQTYADGTGAYECYITVPKDFVGAHDVIAKDEAGPAIGATFTITSKIVVDPDEGLPGDPVTVTGTGFAKSVKVGIGFGAEVPLTGEVVGTGDGITKAFALDYNPVKLGSQVISAPGIGEATFTTVGTTTAPTAITVTAPGITADFTAALYDAAGTTELVAPIDSTGDNTVADTVVLTYTYVASTAYTVKITFADETGSYTLADDGDPAGSGGPIVISEYTYTITTEYTINYATGVITFVTAPVLGLPITAAYTHYTYGVTPLAGITTNATGSFEAVIEIPAILEANYGDYDVTAVDATGNSATDTITVNYYITVKPTSGPPGITVDVSGRVEPAKSVEVKFGKAASWVTAFATTSDADGYFSGEYTLPTLLDEATYQFKAIWDGKEVTADFDVGPAPTIMLTPTSGAAGAEVTISGDDFSAEANVTVYFDTTVVNTTTTDSAGAFTCTFIVPSVAVAVYKVTAEDQYGASAEKYFTVVLPPAVVIEPRATEYLQGDTISFYISSTLAFTGDIAIEIVDPDGYPFWSVSWTPGPIDTAVWGVPYEDQLDGNNLHLTLPSDAPLGSWNWTATYTIDATLKTATGLFTVAMRPTISTILDRLDELDAKIVNLDGDVATLSTTVGTVKTSVDSIGLKVTSIEGDIATIETALGTIEGKVTSIDGNVATIETDVGTIEADISDIQEDVSEIGVAEIPAALTWAVYAAVIFAVIAAIAAIYSIFELRRKVA